METVAVFLAWVLIDNCFRNCEAEGASFWLSGDNSRSMSWRRTHKHRNFPAKRHGLHPPTVKHRNKVNVSLWRTKEMSVWFMLGCPLALRSEWFLELLDGFGYSFLSKLLSTFQKHSLCSDPIICSFLSTKSRVRSAQRGKKTAIRYFCKFFLNYVTCIISNTFRWFIVTSCGSLSALYRLPRRPKVVKLLSCHLPSLNWSGVNHICTL